MTTCAKMPSWSKCLSKSMSCSRQIELHGSAILTSGRIKCCPSPQLQASLNSWPTTIPLHEYLMPAHERFYLETSRATSVARKSARHRPNRNRPGFKSFREGHGRPIPSRHAVFLHRELRRSRRVVREAVSIHTKAQPPSRSWATY